MEHGRPGARWLALALLAASLLIDQARAGEALALRAVAPEEQAGRLIGLFRGTRAENPAAALSAYIHARGGRHLKNKALEAAIAALNPGMVRELKGLDGAELIVGFDTGRARWRAIVPGDDGSLAAVGPALALTDGAAEPPLGEVAVWRLGPPGAILSAKGADRLALASTRDGLDLALNRPLDRDDRKEAPGWHVRLDPSGLGAVESLAGRRLAEALDAVGCLEVRGRLALEEDEVLALRLDSMLAPGAIGRGRLDPAWLDLVPAEATLAAFSTVIDNRPGALDAAFAALDRVERVDPARAGVAPIRARLNLLAAVAKVRPEVDLWPRLKGVTIAVLADEHASLAGAIVALHAIDPGAATRIVDEVVPRLASTFLQGKAPAGPPGDSKAKALGTVEGRPLAVLARDSDVLIGWGSAASLAPPRRSAGPELRAGWGEPVPQRVGGFWPARLRGLSPPLAAALAGSPPVVWRGWTEGDRARDVVLWNGLRAAIARGLDALPLEPPPDR